MRRFGYRTGAVTSLGVLNEGTNLAQGFSHYDDDMGGEWERWYRTADEVVAAAQSWIDEVGDEPFFLWLHLSDPHEPYLEKGAPPDVRLTLDGESASEWNLTTKEEYRDRSSSCRRAATSSPGSRCASRDRTTTRTPRWCSTWCDSRRASSRRCPSR